MNQVDCNSILQAIKFDNLVLFSGLTKNNENISLGRFPLLSLCYLYNAKHIISEYKNKLNILTNYTVVFEPLEIYQKFKAFAGRSLRLYVNQNSIVSPIEMLAILGKDVQVKKLYKFYVKHNIQLCEIESNLKTIYLIKEQKFEVVNTKIKLSAKRLSKPQRFCYKFAIVTTTICAVLFCAGFSVLNITLGLGVGSSPFKIYNQSQLYNALKTNGNYQLQSDIVVTKAFDSVEFCGTLNGNGYTLNVQISALGCLIKTNQGIIENLNVQYDKVESKNLSNSSLFVGTNDGTIKNVNVSCNFLNVGCKTTTKTNTFVSGVVTKNNGNVENCNVKMCASIYSVGGGECLFAGIVGENYGKISSCHFLEDSKIETTSVDIAGICAYNSYNATIENCSNRATLSQVNSDESWSPTVGGINTTNYGNINNCINYANVKSQSSTNSLSDTTNVFVGGISALNYGNILKCLNKGEIFANSQTSVVYAGGITAYSTYWISNNVAYLPTIDSCGVDCDIDVETENEKTYAFVGGVSGYLYGDVVATYSLATFKNGYTENKYYVGLFFGSAYMEYQIIGYLIYIKPLDNYVLYQENVNYHIGTLISVYGISNDIGTTNVSSGITICFSKTDITNGDIYWNETM